MLCLDMHAHASCVHLYVPQVPWQKDWPVRKDGARVSPSEDLRYYSRGLFNNLIITNLDGLRGKVREGGRKGQGAGLWTVSSEWSMQ
jgi:hypothetical protein